LDQGEKTRRTGHDTGKAGIFIALPVNADRKEGRPERG
jgi:hypothetical protein